MLTILFAAGTVICAFGWLNSYVCRMAILYYYMEMKHQDKPDKAAMEKCLKEAWQHLFS